MSSGHSKHPRVREVAPAAAGRFAAAVDARAVVSPADEWCRLMAAVATRRDRGAFARLFGYFAPRVKALLLRSGLEDGLAEEVTQETMLAVWRKASYFDPCRAGVSTWIFTIARNRRVDRLRRERVRAQGGAFDPCDEPDPPCSGEDIAITAERERQLRTAMAALTKDQAAIVRLSFFADKPHAEIARELAIPLGTVKSRVRLALNRLRALMDVER